MRCIAMFAMILFLMASASAALADPMDGFKWKRFEVAEKRVGIEGFAFVVKSNIIQASLETFSYTLGSQLSGLIFLKEGEFNRLK